MPEDSKKFAGKFETPEAFEKGLGEWYGHLGLPVPKVMVGDGGVFKDHAEAEAAYTKSVGIVSAKKAEPKNEEAPKPGESGLSLSTSAIGDDDDPEAILTKAGLDPTEVLTEYGKTGKLRDADFAALKKVGVPKKLAERLARGIAAEKVLEFKSSAELRAQIEADVGGKDVLDSLLQNAGSVLDADELAEYDARIKNAKTARTAVRDLNARVKAAKPGGFIAGGKGGGSGTKGASTLDEIAAASRDVMQGDAKARTVLENTDIEELARAARL